MTDASSRGRPAGEAGGGSLSKDLVFTMLSNQRRRHVIHYLKQRGEQVTVRDLSRQVAAWENGVGVEQLDYKQRKRVYTSLHQTHLPKLDDAGIVEYDRDRGTVSLGSAAVELDVYMEVVPENELPWSVYYLGLSLLSLLTVPLVWLDVFPLSLVPDAAFAGVVAAVFGLSAAAQTYRARDSRLGTPGPPPAGASDGLHADTVPDGGADDDR
jgi:DNA-binding transcriptional ArsR family regulator